MITLIKERLKGNENITITENPTGYAYHDLCGYSILGIHGEVKDLGASINDFSRVYRNKIDYLIGGHVHSSHNREVGIDCEVFSVRSIVGVDPYGLSLNKTSNAGASCFVFEYDEGVTQEYKIKL